MKMKIFSLVIAAGVLCCSTVSNVASATEIVETETVEVANMAAVPEPDAELMYTTVNYGNMKDYYLTSVGAYLNGSKVKAARVTISGNSNAQYKCVVTTPNGKEHSKIIYGNGKESTIWASLFAQSGEFKFHISMYNGTAKKVNVNLKITK